MAQRKRSKEVLDAFKAKDTNIGIYLDTDHQNGDPRCLYWESIYNLFVNDTFSQYGDDLIFFQEIKSSNIHAIVALLVVIPYKYLDKWMNDFAYIPLSDFRDIKNTIITLDLSYTNKMFNIHLFSYIKKNIYCN